MQRIDDKSIERRKFVGVREGWTEEYNFWQPIIDDVVYEVAFCGFCSVVINFNAEGSSYLELSRHWQSRKSANGACQKRRLGGKTESGLEILTATPIIRRRIQEV